TGEEAATPSFIEDTWFGKKVILEMNELKTIQQVYEDYVSNIYTGQLYSDGGYWYSAGLQQQINDGSGVVQAFTGSLSEAFIQSVIQQCASNGAFAMGKVSVVCNTKFQAQFQSIVGQPYVYQTGVLNTFGVKAEQGIDVMMYQFAGSHWELIIDPS